MKKSIKALLTVLCLIVLVAGSVLGTLAYMTDREEVVNTFTVGNVKIAVNEAPIGEDGKATTGDRVTGNKYHLIPGMTYDKDPTMTVLKGSEESYVRMMVTINEIADLKAAFGNDFEPKTILGEWGTGWSFTGIYSSSETEITYEYRYDTAVSAIDEAKELAPLFKTLTVPGKITGDQLETIKNLEITVEGHAIQTAAFKDADEAWAAFKEQNG